MLKVLTWIYGIYSIYVILDSFAVTTGFLKQVFVFSCSSLNCRIPSLL